MVRRRPPTANVTVRRYDPERGTNHEQVYEVPFDKTWSVVNSLVYIYEELDPSLGAPYTCLQGRCMGCAVKMNGKAVCACSTPMAETMTLEPLAKCGVVRDLIVDFTPHRIVYDPEKCTKCGHCVTACPINIWRLSAATGLAEIDKDDVLCIGCEECQRVCEDDAIRIIAAKADGSGASAERLPGRPR